MMYYHMVPRLAFLACSILVFLMEAPAPNTAVEEVDRVPSSTEELKIARAKRQLIGTPSIPLMDPKRKRPFCNAFTGCGKKRSDGAGRMGFMGKMGQMPENDLMDPNMSDSDSLATLVELNSEPAVAELSRQILSEAKLWEAIQEARQEMSRRRQQQMAERQPRGRPNPIELTGIRKRREAPPAIPKGTLPSAGNGALPIV